MRIVYNFLLFLCLQMHKRLAAFDFDHTIIEKNSYVVAMDILACDKFPSFLKQLHRTGWTAFMQGIFDLLHNNNVDEITIRQSIQDLEPIKGMSELIKDLNENLNYDVIIISDSNSYFINTWLASNNLKSNVKRVFTNPARFHNGHLKIEMYHFQDKCTLSTKNLCKGQILEEFVAEQQDAGVIYDKIIYVGDGSNDICPILRLNQQDMGCVRNEYKCMELVKKAKDGQPLDKSGKQYNLKCDILVWDNGFDILEAVTTDKICDSR